jgi:hypothetical protein
MDSGLGVVMGEHESSSTRGTFSNFANVPANVSEILRVVRKILLIQEAQVKAIDDLNQAVTDLQSEDGLVISGLNDLASKIASGGTVTEADINAVKDNVVAEVSKLQAALQTDDPSVTPQPPAPAGP